MTLSRGEVRFIPVQFVWLVGITLIIIFFMSYHKFGNWVYVTGDNKLAAKAMGINTDRIKTVCFMLVGVAVGFAARHADVPLGHLHGPGGRGVGSSTPSPPSVVGGTALSGGIGNMAGVFWGTLVISLIENGLVLMRIQYWWTFTVFGVVIIASVIISKIIEKRRMMAGAEIT